ncbi:MAG: hypothetical protein WBD40_14570 [Tepidisphaeraceae bacterium]
MVAAIRQTVTIGAGGRVEVQSPQLKEGSRAEVIVLLEDPSSPASKLAALDRLQKSLNLDETRAREWIRQAREERQAFGPRE